MSPAKPRVRRSIGPKTREKFLETLAGGSSVRHAARITGHPHQSFYDLRSNDETFAAAWAEALDAGTQVLEQQAFEIAMTGVVEEVRDGEGRITSTRRRPDPQMVRFLLQARRPGVYSERARVELTGRDGGPVELDPGFQPTTLRDVVALAGELGVLDALGFRRNEIDGETVDELPALTKGDE